MYVPIPSRGSKGGIDDDGIFKAFAGAATTLALGGAVAMGVVNYADPPSFHESDRNVIRMATDGYMQNRSDVAKYVRKQMDAEGKTGKVHIGPYLEDINKLKELGKFAKQVEDAAEKVGVEKNVQR